MKDKIIQIVCDSSKEGYLLFGLTVNGRVYQQSLNGWKLLLDSPSDETTKSEK